jgi:hypothetical protein
MIIIGHPLVDFKPFYKIGDIKSIKNTPPNSILLFEFNENKISYFRYCRENDISFAVEVKDIKELLITNANKASFALLSLKFAKEAQKLADDYLFDMRILAKIESEEEMIKMSHERIDGVIFKRSIIDGES